MPTLLERLGRALLGEDDTHCCDPSAPALRLIVKCRKCGELISTRIEKAYELEAEYELNNGHSDEEEPRPSGFVLHKEMLGVRCQNLVQVEMHMDVHRGMTSRTITGGDLIEFADCE